MSNQTALYIDNAAALAELCTRLRHAPWIALDTEFVREKTFYPRLCLAQLATDGLLACVDPLALPALEPLLAVLYDPAITKVMHAARQDLEIFYHLRGELQRPVFDTQLAAPLLGLKEQMGYASLVETLLDVKLDKAHTRADWSQRPLSAAQLRGLHEQTAARHGEAILQIVATAQDRAPIPLPPVHQGAPLSEAQEAVVDLLLAVVRKLSAEQAIHPNLVAGRKEMERLVSGDDGVSVLHGWRRQLAGESLLAVLRGDVRLHVRDGALQFIAADD